MADSKITALAALTAADPVNDMFPVVDVSDTSMAASGTTKRISVNNILSSSPTASGALTITGLVTAGSANITGDLTVDTSTLKVDSTNNRVGIGTATPSGVLHTVQTAAAAYVSNLFENTSATGFVNLGMFVGAAGANGTCSIKYAPGTFTKFGPDANDTTTPIYLVTNNGTTRMEIAAAGAGDVKINTGNVVMATSGKGIDFSATAEAAGMTSELLNDYEEGTWTPTVTAETGTIGATTVISTAYTKIGRLVSITFDIQINAVGTGSGGLKVSLPFFPSIGQQTCGAGREYINTGNMCQVFKNDTSTVLVYFYNNSTVIGLNNRVMCGYTYFV